MKLVTITLAALSALVAAQSNGYYDVASSGFRLIVKSSNSTLNG